MQIVGIERIRNLRKISRGKVGSDEENAFELTKWHQSEVYRGECALVQLLRTSRLGVERSLLIRKILRFRRNND